MMEVLQAIATSIGVIGLILFMLCLALRLFGTKIAAWHCFSKSKLYNANGYLVSIAFAYTFNIFLFAVFFFLNRRSDKKCVEILMEMKNMLLECVFNVQLYQFCLEPSAHNACKKNVDKMVKKPLSNRYTMGY